MKFPEHWDAHVASQMMETPGGTPDDLVRIAARLHTESDMDEWDIVVVLVDGMAQALGEAATETALNNLTRMLMALMNLSEETVLS